MSFVEIWFWTLLIATSWSVTILWGVRLQRRFDNEGKLPGVFDLAVLVWLISLALAVVVKVSAVVKEMS